MLPLKPGTHLHSEPSCLVELSIVHWRMHSGAMAGVGQGVSALTASQVIATELTSSYPVLQLNVATLPCWFTSVKATSPLSGLAGGLVHCVAVQVPLYALPSQVMSPVKPGTHLHSEPSCLFELSIVQSGTGRVHSGLMVGVGQGIFGAVALQVIGWTAFSV